MWKIIALFVLLEFLEAYWQKSDTLMGSLAKSYYFYNKSIFLLLFMHIGYLYTLYISLALDIVNWAIIAILVLKSFDIFTKIYIIEKVFVKKEADDALLEVLSVKTPFWYYLIGVSIYPYLMYIALL